ncbi:hypothetical protein Tco_0348705 [Tanacetum coccineum]
MEGCLNLSFLNFHGEDVKGFSVASYSMLRNMERVTPFEEDVMKSQFVPNSANKTVNAPLKSVTVNGGNQIVARNGGNRPYRLTQKELEEKRAKNQCFYCEQKYFPGHKCSGQLYYLEIVSENQEELVIEGNDETFEDYVEEGMISEPSP